MLAEITPRQGKRSHELVQSDEERDELSPSPSPLSSPPPPPKRQTRKTRSRRATTKPQAIQTKTPAVTSSTQPAATPKSPKRSRAAPRKASKTSSKTTAAEQPRGRRRKPSPTPAPVEEHAEDTEEGGIEGDDDEGGPLSRHRSRSRSLSIIPTVDMPALTHPAPDDAAVRALGLPQSSRPGASNLSLDRDHLIRMREGHFAHARPLRKRDENRNWKKFSLAEAAWTRLEEVMSMPKGRAWTTHEGYDDQGEPVKPDLPYVILTKLVIASSPRKMLTLNQIYQAMEERWPYYRTLGQTFRNSIRHNLSINPAFVNIERPLSEGGLGTGKGGYWKVSEDTTTSHRGRAKKPRLEEPEEGRNANAVNTRSPPTLPTGGMPRTQPYQPRPFSHMPSSFDGYPGFGGAHPHPSHPPQPQAQIYALREQAHCSPSLALPLGHSPSAYHRPSNYPEHGERSTLAPRRGNDDSPPILSPTHSLPEMSTRRSSINERPRLSHRRPVHPATLPHHTPPSLVRAHSTPSTQSPPDYRITTPPQPHAHDGLSSLMQLATVAEHDQVNAKARTTLPPLDHAIPSQQRLPSVNALLNPPSLSSQLDSQRTVCG